MLRGKRASFLELEIRREQLCEDSLKLLQNQTKTQLMKRTRITFVGEEGIDSGGLTKEWYMEVSRELQKASAGLFQESDSDGKFTELKPCALGNKRGNERCRLVGKFIGKALFDRQLLDLRWPDATYKHLIGAPVDMHDLAQVDSSLAQSLRWMRTNDITGALFETFSVMVQLKATGPPEEIDLVEGGRDMDVTEGNKVEYIEKMIQFRTRYRVNEQIEELFKGIRTLVPLSLLQPFSWSEVRMLLNGQPYINVDEIRAYTIYDGYQPDDLPVLWLWQAIREFAAADRGLALAFITGCSKVPLDGYNPPFQICKMVGDVTALPRGQTCFNQIQLPVYSSYEVLVEKLVYAMKNTEGFALE